MALRNICIYKTFFNKINKTCSRKSTSLVCLLTGTKDFFFKFNNQKYYETSSIENNLKEILTKVENSLKEQNIHIYFKQTKENVDMINETKKNSNEIDHMKFLSLLNKIITTVENDRNLQIDIWGNSIVKDLLTFLKIKIPAFQFDELFLFLLCFSKIQFIPQVLLNEVLNIIKEKSFLKSFYEYDRTKFFQLLLILSTLKNIKKSQNNMINSNFHIFINNYVKLFLDNFKNKKNKNKTEIETEIETETEKNHTDIDNRDTHNEEQLTLNHYMLMCTALYNFNIRHFELFYEISNEIIDIIEHFNLSSINRKNKDIEKIDVSKKIINIYLSYCSLGFDNSYFYDKLNSFLYNTVSDIPISDCVTLLLCISTLKEQRNFQFPLCLINNLEKALINKFYALDSKDLLLLIYLFTYLKLYLCNYEHYINMFDYLFHFQDCDLEREENKLKLFQIHASLIGPSLLQSVTQKEKKQVIEKDVEKGYKELDLNYTTSTEEVRVKNLVVKKLKEKGILDKIKQSLNLNVEENESQLDGEINHAIENLILLLKEVEFYDSFELKKVVKNKILLNYYLNHIYIVFSKKGYSKKEYEIVFHFDTNTFDDLENPIDVYMNMKKHHIRNLNVKYVLLNLSLWKQFSNEKKKKVLLKEMNEMIMEECNKRN